MADIPPSPNGTTSSEANGFYKNDEKVLIDVACKLHLLLKAHAVPHALHGELACSMMGWQRGTKLVEIIAKAKKERLRDILSKSRFKYVSEDSWQQDQLWYIWQGNSITHTHTLKNGVGVVISLPNVSSERWNSLPEPGTVRFRAQGQKEGMLIPLLNPTEFFREKLYRLALEPSSKRDYHDLRSQLARYQQYLRTHGVKNELFNELVKIAVSRNPSLREDFCDSLGMIFQERNGIVEKNLQRLGVTEFVDLRGTGIYRAICQKKRLVRPANPQVALQSGRPQSRQTSSRASMRGEYGNGSASGPAGRHSRQAQPAPGPPPPFSTQPPGYSLDGQTMRGNNPVQFRATSHIAGQITQPVWITGELRMGPAYVDSAGASHTGDVRDQPTGRAPQSYRSRRGESRRPNNIRRVSSSIGENSETDESDEINAYFSSPTRSRRVHQWQGHGGGSCYIS